MLGLGWSLLHPLVLMLVYLLVFSVLWRVAEVGSDDYWLFLLCGGCRSVRRQALRRKRNPGAAAGE